MLFLEFKINCEGITFTPLWGLVLHARQMKNGKENEYQFFNL